jgi:hypothetical protein
MPERVGTRYNEDKTAMRTGWILEENATETVLKGIEEYKQYISRNYTESKKITKINELMNILELLKGAVFIGYPAYNGLPEWEPVKQIIEEKTDILEKDEAQFEVFIYFYFSLKIFSFINSILLHYGMLGKNMSEGNSYVIMLEKMKKLKLFVNFQEKEPVPQQGNLWLIRRLKVK